MSASVWVLALVAGFLTLTLTLGQYEDEKDANPDDEDAVQLLNITGKSREPLDYHKVVALDLKLEKWVGLMWFTAPCSKIPGSCHHANICADLAPLTCPSTYDTCHCPFKQGTYTLTPTVLSIQKGDVPSGHYRLTLWLKQGSKELGCLYMQLAVA